MLFRNSFSVDLHVQTEAVQWFVDYAGGSVDAFVEACIHFRLLLLGRICVVDDDLDGVFEYEFDEPLSHMR